MLFTNLLCLWCVVDVSMHIQYASKKIPVSVPLNGQAVSVLLPFSLLSRTVCHPFFFYGATVRFLSPFRRPFVKTARYADSREPRTRPRGVSTSVERSL